MIERRFTGLAPETKLPAGTIDTHLHVYLSGFPAQPGGPDLPVGLPELKEYRQLMDWLGIERFVITQGNAHQTDNANLLAALKETRDAARGVAAIDGETSDAELEMLKDGGVVGTRIVDLPGGAVGLNQLEEVDARAFAAGWMIAIQFDGSDISDHVDRLAKLRSRWVLDHHGKFLRGGPPGGADVAVLKHLVDGGRCWFKFAGCYESSIEGGPNYSDVAKVSKAMAAHAPERIVWGTNFPHNSATKTLDYPNDAVLLDTVLNWFPNDRARHLALVENAEELYCF
ncbi:amidohydrolase [Phaeobacter gallaeciensis]|uniref:Amidohydrolase n=2 Tax=Roseobacteraceae TaxID=2854170 RepID=A0A366WS88_9RHOB|nr:MULTISPECIES: amidohydrolase family protein [Roseobacteraceae]MBT3143127.1 amidohydrolase family protein [Falsiruegeria litorea]MBT8171223.1 amidohydrolase family protein [Falsiruegeria litorea]RBW51661.1 amidohydrolase [Phaeobacter gallaeciensis]